MYHHSSRKNRLFILEYIPIQSVRFHISKLLCGGGLCNRLISHLQRGRAILRKDLKKDHQINMIYEDICSEFYLFAVTEQIFTEHGDYKKKVSELAHNAFQ